MWAEEILKHLKVEVTVKGKVENQGPLLLVGNHISYLDIPLLLKAAPSVSFVSKKEVASWPVIGSTARRIETIFVERENGSSRAKARAEILKSFTEENKQVAVFPSGTTCVFEKKDWKRGIFEIAHESQVKVQPFRICYFPLRAVAYIDDDIFFPHLMNLVSHQKIEAEIEFHPPIVISNPTFDRIHWQRWAQKLI